MSKKLGEIWSTVSASEKDLWKRRAKRFAAKEKSHFAVAKVVASENGLFFLFLTDGTVQFLWRHFLYILGF